MQYDFDDFSAQLAGRKIICFRNGEDVESVKGCEIYLDITASFANFLHIVSNKLSIHATRCFSLDGTEHDDVVTIDEGDSVYISSGEGFKPNRAMIKNISKPRIEKYIIDRFVGQGAFGKVYKGIHSTTSEVCALKFMKKKMMHSTGDAERIMIEMQCLETLHHENVIRLLDCINTSNDVVLVFEYAPGGDLQKYVNGRQRLGELESVCLFSQILSGVAYCHQHRIAHQDLKLENILLSSTGVIKIADFGLSAFYRPGATSKSGCGSLAYIAPEVFERKGAKGPPRDIWSLGVILYHMLFGTLPFNGHTVEQVKKKIMSGQFSLPTDIHISRECTDVMNRMLTRDPSRRWSAAQLLSHPWFERRRDAIAKMRESIEQRFCVLETSPTARWKRAILVVRIALAWHRRCLKRHNKHKWHVSASAAVAALRISEPVKEVKEGLTLPVIVKPTNLKKHRSWKLAATAARAIARFKISGKQNRARRPRVRQNTPPPPIGNTPNGFHHQKSPHRRQHNNNNNNMDLTIPLTRPITPNNKKRDRDLPLDRRRMSLIPSDNDHHHHNHHHKQPIKPSPILINKRTASGRRATHANINIRHSPINISPDMHPPTGDHSHNNNNEHSTGTTTGGVHERLYRQAMTPPRLRSLQRQQRIRQRANNANNNNNNNESNGTPTTPSSVGTREKTVTVREKDRRRSVVPTMTGLRERPPMSPMKHSHLPPPIHTPVHTPTHQYARGDSYNSGHHSGRLSSRNSQHSQYSQYSQHSIRNSPLPKIRDPFDR